MSRKIFFLASILFLSAAAANAQTGREIMEWLDAANEPDTSHALVKMNIIEADGSLKERVFEEWSALDTTGRKHRVIVFHTPASVRDTRFLVKENEDRDDDQWIYLPALRKVRRISASEGGDSFMGTEFSYDDLKSREIDDYSYTRLGDGEALGYACWIVESLPKAGTESQYSRVLRWITRDREIMRTLRMELFGEDEEIEKIFTVEKLEIVDSYWTPLSVLMKNTRTGRGTRLVQQRIELDKPVNPRRFTTRYLETGRTE
ncbi:hypothetical protein B4O97_07945 [Marispirochaeta aestuarii]|uniref:Uncharacterized protein TP-0789 domain-containing protein n=1 Tax=Marispirochaeta aestuarii TaxID=1963862 RepID=A0A1Y1RZD7_9SPIO|nr:outer membrane lipoprotein-sorting protein [Marispirochaeta aestuarii]ORC35991.1 hypothetical protein B4O97_07945 [Marispirochaeta aestuarii]